MLQSADGLLKLVNAIIWLRKTKLGLSFLLALSSWFVLSLLWNMTEEGSSAFKFIAALIDPGYNAGHYLATIFFGDDPQHRAAASLIGLGCLLVMYMAFWYAVIAATSGMWSDKPSGSDESLSEPEA
jgi:hypothetical protein